VKMDDGTIRHVANVPESTKVNVDGRELGIHDLKPGMKLQRTISTTTTPQTITTVKTVTGKVWHISPPSSVILTLEDGTNQQFKIPKGQKFTVDGQQMDAWGLKKGMRVSATTTTATPRRTDLGCRSRTGAGAGRCCSRAAKDWKRAATHRVARQPLFPILDRTGIDSENLMISRGSGRPAFSASAVSNPSFTGTRQTRKGLGH
jgi:hypothetical protein